MRAGDPLRRTSPDTRRRHRDPQPATGPGRRRRAHPHPAHPPAPRPHSGLALLPAPVRRAQSRDHLGALGGGCVFESAHRALSFRPPDSGRRARAALPARLSRLPGERVGHRRRTHPRRSCQPPRADAGVSHRRRRGFPVLPARPRARAARSRSGSPATPSPGRRTCWSTTASTPTRSTRTTSAGGTPRSPIRSPSPIAATRGACSSSTTTPSTATISSTMF